MVNELYNMSIPQSPSSATDFPICILTGEINGQMNKEALSKRDLITTLMAMLSFMMLPHELQRDTDMNDWVSKRGGSPQTVSQITQSVGKSDPKNVEVKELKNLLAESVPPPAPFATPSRPSVSPASPTKGLPIQDATDAVEEQQEPSVKQDHAVPYQSYWRGLDKKYRHELNDEVVENSLNLMKRVNALLKELGVANAKVNSGWRPPTYNEELRRKGIPAARKSRHITGEAIDLSDQGHAIANAVLRDPSILVRHGLWMEDPASTRSWVHFDLGTGRNPDKMPDGSPRKMRVFRP